MERYNIGIDVGSTTAKMVVLDLEGHLVWKRYERHNANVNELLRNYFTDLTSRLGNAEVRVHVTGSVGMATAEQLQAPFVQEVVAAMTYVRRLHPEAKALIDIGGEDSKIVLFEGSNTELRMNGNCAGGTGAFIDQMSALLGISNQELGDEALSSTRVYAMAARCGVFAKTDVQNLISRNVPQADIAASIFHSIAVQTVTTLAHGCTLQPPVLFCGGPLTYLPALRKAFADYLQWPSDRFIVTPESNLIPAVGSALSDGGNFVSLSEVARRAEAPLKVVLKESLKPLFRDADDWKAWRAEKDRYAVTVEPMRSHEQVTIGIDSGSTTTKVVAARPDGTLLFTYYVLSKGHPIQAALDGLHELEKKASESHCQLDIIGSCSTGYGEELIKAALNLDCSTIETMAHYYAARRLMPDVSFILDIGGQDMKAIFVEQGIVKRMELNEACSSGCGTFLQTFAESLGYNVADFARLACGARHPCDLGTRCTVFMNSKIKQVLREGASVADISAGLAYSVVNNCLFKVLKFRDATELGHRIVVQGGTMRNDAVVRALEILTGAKVARSNMPELMGAYGCALYAAAHATTARPLSAFTEVAGYESRELHCKGCDNQCAVTRYRFASGNSYFSGNKCERVFTNSGRKVAPGRNVYKAKLKLLFDRPVIEDAPRRIGLPRALNMYEDYPFWHALLTACGFGVALSPESEMPAYEAALCTVMSDNICFPAKLVHSHVEALAANPSVERILMPYVVYEHNDCPSAINSYNCPIVSGYSDVIRSAIDVGKPVDTPVINFADRGLLRKQIVDYLRTLGVGHRQAVEAFRKACRAQDDYTAAVKKEAEDVLAASKAAGRLTILLAGRPYHTDELIQHRLSEMIAALGADVISEDIVRQAPTVADGSTNTVRQWAYVNRIIKAAQWTGTQDASVQFVEMTSFGCGPDAFIQDEVRDLLSRHGKTLTLLKIDDVSNTGSLKLRVRSLIESLRQHTGRSLDLPLLTTPPFTEADRGKTILAPYISEYVTPLLPALGKAMGYRVVVMPESDAETEELGLRYANNEVCYPATLIVGDFIRALRSGHYDVQNTVCAMTQTGGQCRATNYAGLIKRAMVSAGFGNVPLVTLGVTTSADDAHTASTLKVNWRKLAPLMIVSLLYADTIAKFFYATVVRERQKGEAAALRDRYLNEGADIVARNDTKALLALIGEAAADFNRAALDREARPVGVVGEIFLKFNHFAHQHIMAQLIEHGCEVVPPLITPFFLQEFVNVVRNDRLGLHKSSLPLLVIKGLYALVARKMKQINRVASRFRYFRPFTNIYAEAEGANGIVSPAAQFGEGWLLPAEVVEMSRSGVNDVVSVQPFGCIANHVVAKGVARAIRRRCPDMNFLTLDFSAGVSQVNVTNRLLLFLGSREVEKTEPVKEAETEAETTRTASTSRIKPDTKQGEQKRESA